MLNVFFKCRIKKTLNILISYYNITIDFFSLENDLIFSIKKELILIKIFKTCKKNKKVVKLLFL